MMSVAGLGRAGRRRGKSSTHVLLENAVRHEYGAAAFLAVVAVADEHLVWGAGELVLDGFAEAGSGFDGCHFGC